MYVPIANQQGDQQEDCGTPMCSFQHCPICAWTKQASCAHVDASPAWLKELRTNSRKGITRDLCNTAMLMEVILHIFHIHTGCQAEYNVVPIVQVPAPKLPSFSFATNVKCGILEG